jgi:3-oxoacyl-[acyl-carrier protein] reductase
VNRFAGRTALITGASRGIGLGIAERLVAEGARVVLTARSPRRWPRRSSCSAAPRVRSRLPGKGDDLEHQADAVAQAVATFGSLDVLVNNAGSTPRTGR